MRQHFRHSNFSSFVRQLNFYGQRSRAEQQAETTQPQLTAPSPPHAPRLPHCLLLLLLPAGFHKRSTPANVTQFDHPDFKRGREDLLHRIVRKPAGGGEKERAERGEGGARGERAGGAGAAEAYRDDIRELDEQVQQLRSQYEELARMQQRILFIFGRYVQGAAGGADGRRRRRFVRGGDEEDEERRAEQRAGGSGGAAKRARLMIESLQQSAAGDEDVKLAAASRGRGQQQQRRSSGSSAVVNPLAGIDWGEQHAMHELIHSPYLRGAPAALSTTPIPMELPPLSASQPAASALQPRSPHPLLLTAGGEDGAGKREAVQGRRQLAVPAVGTGRGGSAGRRQRVGVFYDAGVDSPSSQSSTSTEDAQDRQQAAAAASSASAYRQLFSPAFAAPSSSSSLLDEPSMPPLLSDEVVARWAQPARTASVVVHSPLAELDLLHPAAAVKVEQEPLEPVSPFPFSMTPAISSPQPLDSSIGMQDVDEPSLLSASTAAADALPPLPVSALSELPLLPPSPLSSPRLLPLSRAPSPAALPSTLFPPLSSSAGTAIRGK